LVAIASTRPVDGSSATTAPHFPCRARRASACRPGRIVSTMLLPVTVEPFRRSSVERKTVSRFALEPVRKSLYDCSSPVRLRDCVE
jgi:hypothetical protein